MRTLALALACLLLAAHAAAAGRGLKRAYLPTRQLRALVPGLKAAAAPAPEVERSTSRNTTRPGAKSTSSVLATTVAYGETVVACKEWQPDSLEWDWPDNPPEYTATGTATPPQADVQKLTALICSDPPAAGDRIRSIIEKGGAAAQAAVYAIFAAECDDEEAASDAYGAAIDAVNSGDPADIEAVSSWFENFAEAADAVGIPVCLSLAVVDTDTGKASDEKDFHTTGTAPSRSKSSGSGSRSGSGSGSSGSRSTDSTGSTSTGSGVSSALLDVPDSADPGTTSDGVQAAEVIAGVSDAPIFTGAASP